MNNDTMAIGTRSKDHDGNQVCRTWDRCTLAYVRYKQFIGHYDILKCNQRHNHKQTHHDKQTTRRIYTTTNKHRRTSKQLPASTLPAHPIVPGILQVPHHLLASFV